MAETFKPAAVPSYSNIQYLLRNTNSLNSFTSSFGLTVIPRGIFMFIVEDRKNCAQSLIHQQPAGHMLLVIYEPRKSPRVQPHLCHW